MNGMEGSSESNQGRDQVVEAKPMQPNIGICDLVLRFLAFAPTLVAAMVLGFDKLTKVVQFKFSESSPPLYLPVTAKWQYMSAFVYFVVANAIACAYAALSLLLNLASGGKIKGLASLIIIIDGAMVALLFSANGAATAVALLGHQGNSHVQWNKVCNLIGKFCDKAAASIVISLVGSLAFLFLVVIRVLGLHRKIQYI